MERLQRCASAVSCNIFSGENGPHFKNPWPQLLSYSLFHFNGATMTIKPCYLRKNSFYPTFKATEFTAHAWPVHAESPKTTRNNYLWPRIVYYDTTFTGLRRRLRAVFGRKKCPVKTDTQWRFFRKCKGINIKYSHRGPQKALPYPERRLWI